MRRNLYNNIIIGPKRTRTMAATLKDSEALIGDPEKSGKGQRSKEKERDEEKNKEKRGRSKSKGSGKGKDKKGSVKRKGTMAAAVDESKDFIKGVKGPLRSMSKKK